MGKWRDFMRSDCLVNLLLDVESVLEALSSSNMERRECNHTLSWIDTIKGVEEIIWSSAFDHISMRDTRGRSRRLQRPVGSRRKLYLARRVLVKEQDRINALPARSFIFSSIGFSSWWHSITKLQRSVRKVVLHGIQVIQPSTLYPLVRLRT